jgi:hypothetical protein
LRKFAPSKIRSRPVERCNCGSARMIGWSSNFRYRRGASNHLLFRPPHCD